MTKQSRIKTATVYVVSVNIICPHCGESIPSPSGSLQWTHEVLPELIRCRDCYKTSRPAKRATRD